MRRPAPGTSSVTAAPPRPPGRPSRHVASANGAAEPPSASSSRTASGPRRPAPRPGRRTTRSPPKASDRAGPPLALGVRRPGHQAVRVVDPEPALLPGAGGQRHQPAQAVASRPRRPRGRCRARRASRRPARRSAAAARRSRPGRRRGRPPRGSATGRSGRPRRRSCPRRGARDRAGVEEVELEVVDAEVHQARERRRRAGRGRRGWVRSRPTRSSPQLRPAGPTSQSGCSVASVAVRADEERRQPDARPPAARRGPRRRTACSDPKWSATREPLAQPGAPAVVDLDHVDDQVVVVEGAQVLQDVVGGDLLEVAVPGAPHRRRGRREHDAGRRGEPVGVRRQRGLRVVAPSVASTGPVDRTRTRSSTRVAVMVGTSTGSVAP